MAKPNDEQLAGVLLVSARARLGLSQSEFAARIGVAQPTLSAYESGRRQPTLPMLLRLLRRAGFELRTELTMEEQRPGWEDLIDDADRAWLQRLGAPGLPAPDDAKDRGDRP
jgi:transcriptional regulator with XRE-family HTH domain